MRRISKSAGFTLIELLTATFIFSAVVLLVYGLINEAMFSKRQLDAVLELNEQVKSVHTLIQSTLREANGKFFEDGEFVNCYPSGPHPEGFFISYFYEDIGTHCAPTDTSRLALDKRGAVLYVKNKERGEIYVFNIATSSTSGPFIFETWKKNSSSGKWERKEQTVLLNIDSFKDPHFEISLRQVVSGGYVSYQQSTTSDPPYNYNSWVKIKAEAVKSVSGVFGSGSRELRRELDQVYVPLIFANPYL